MSENSNVNSTFYYLRAADIIMFVTDKLNADFVMADLGLERKPSTVAIPPELEQK